MPDSTLSTLKQIRIKVRRITKSPSNSQVTDAQIDDYVNSFVLYDLPSSLKLSDLNTTLTFYTDKHVETYSTNTVDATDPLYNFNNRFSVMHAPVYIEGTESLLVLTEQEARGIYPQTQCRLDIGTGNGVVADFVGTVDNIPIKKGSVIFSSTNNLDVSLKAFADDDGNVTGDAAGAIDYESGDYGIVFSSAPKNGETIYLSYIPFTAGKPDTILYKDNEFKLMPIPDGIYKVEIQGFMRPTELLNDNAIPLLAEWWEYIAYGACRKIFQDRSDFESVNNISQEIERQEILVNRKTIVQNSEKRTYTIYS